MMPPPSPAAQGPGHAGQREYIVIIQRLCYTGNIKEIIGSGVQVAAISFQQKQQVKKNNQDAGELSS
jgi:hypothetical protein